MPESSPHRYPTHIQSHNNCRHAGIGTRRPLEFTVIFVYFATFMLSTCDKVLQSLSYAGSKSSYVPHTYFVSQPPPSYVYSWSNRHPKITRIHGIIAALEDSQVLCSQLAPKCFNHWAMPDSSPHRYPTHTLSHNHCPDPCICVGFVAEYIPKNCTNIWNATFNDIISWARRCVNAWLAAMRQARRSWLARLLTVHTPPPRMSQRGHRKATCELGARKRYVKARNLMSAASPECVVGGNAPGTT